MAALKVVQLASSMVEMMVAQKEWKKVDPKAAMMVVWGLVWVVQTVVNLVA